MKRLMLFAIVCWAGIGSLFAQQMSQQLLWIGEDIRGIDVKGCWDIVITQGDQTGVKLEYDSTLTEKYNVTCELVGTTVYLNVENKDNDYRKNKKGRVYNGSDNAQTRCYAYVTLSALDKLRVSGVCSIMAKDTLAADHCDIDIKGVSQIVDLPLQVQSLNYEQSGVTNLSGLTVKAQKDVDMDISGVGSCSGVSICTAGDLRLQASGVVQIVADIDVNEVAVITSSSVATVCLRGHAVRQTVHSSAAKQIDLSQLEISQ